MASTDEAEPLPERRTRLDLLDENTLLGPRHLVAAAAADLDNVAVWRRPRLRILSTGDELAAPGTARSRPKSIPESISLGVAALAEDWGATVAGMAMVIDRIGEMQRAAAGALADADLVVVTGGASVGEPDFAKQMFANEGLELVFSKVAIKPGKPVWLGRAGGRLVLGLPGNPTSAMVTARLFLAPLLTGLTGRDPAEALRWRTNRAAEPIAAAGNRETFVRGTETREGIHVVPNQNSNAQKALAHSDVLIRLRVGVEGIAPREAVEALPF